MENIETIRQIKKRNADKILALPGVNAIGVGYVQSDTLTKTIGIIVYMDEDALGQSQLPSQIEGIRVEIRPGRFTYPSRDHSDQEENKDLPSNPDPETVLGNPRDNEFEPMIGGVSVNPDFFYINSWQGTLGLAVLNSNDKPVILSNRHVICGKKPVVGDGVCQPSYEFRSHLAASLVDWDEGDISYQGENYGIDAAIALPTNNRTASVGKIYNLPDISGTALATVDMNVMKSGLATDITLGRVVAIDVDILNEDKVRLSNQIAVKSNTEDEPFSKSGDSGSALVETETNKVVGLLWGGNSKTKESICSPIAPILARFNCTIP